MKEESIDAVGLGTWVLYVLLFFVPVLPLLRIVVHPALSSIKEVSALTVAVEFLLLSIFRKKMVAAYDLLLAYLLFFIAYIVAHGMMPGADLIAVFNSLRYMTTYLILGIGLIYLCDYHLRTGGDPERIPRIVRRVFQINFAMGWIVSLCGLYEKFINPGFSNLYGSRSTKAVYLGIEHLRIISTLENPITLGLFMQVAMISATATAYLSRSRWKRILAIASILVFLFVTILTLSRTSYLVLLGLGAVSLGKAFYRANLRNKIILISVIVLACFLAVNVIYPALKQDSLLYVLFENRFSELFDSDTVGRDGRLVTWGARMKEVSGYPFNMFGLGIGHIGWEGDSFVMENGYLGLVYELGLVGLALFLSLMARFAANLIRLRRMSIQVVEAKVVRICLPAFLIAYVIDMAVADAHMNMPLIVYFWVFFAMSEIMVRYSIWKQANP